MTKEAKSLLTATGNIVILLACWKFTPTIMEVKPRGAWALAGQSLYIGAFFITGACTRLG